jgi:uncharacterized membrane protein YkvA (DUF1232 family)
MAAPKTCPSCGKTLGSSAACLSCREAAARELAEQARDVTDESLRARGEAGRRFAEHPPWWARLAPRWLVARVALLASVVGDCAAGRYRRLPWRSIAAMAAALAYVVSPLDLIPDFLVPIGWTDDMLVLVLAWQILKKELREYCEWKGLPPGAYGL